MSYDSLPSKDVLEKTIHALEGRGYLPELVSSRAAGLERIKRLIPEGASIMNGASRTLEEIGFVDYLKEGGHGWNNLHAAILLEKDPAKQAALRRQAVLSDFYLGSAHAVAESGEIVIASNSGSQLPYLVFTSPNIILVVGAQKITSTLDVALKRLEDYVFPLEDARMKSVGVPAGSSISKLLILNREPPFSGRKFHIIVVNEPLGF